MQRKSPMLEPITDAEACEHVSSQFPVPCELHPHAIRVDRDRYGVMVYCKACVEDDALTARLGCGDSETEAIRAWNGLQLAQAGS